MRWIPSAGNYIGNIMNIELAWEDDLKPGPCGSKIAVIDYDGAKQRYYPPVNLNDYRVLARGGLDPSESNPQFHSRWFTQSPWRPSSDSNRPSAARSIGIGRIAFGRWSG